MKWISVESPPENSGYYLTAKYDEDGTLIWISDEYYGAEDLLNDEWCWSDNCTHWMPLPEPPKED